MRPLIPPCWLLSALACAGLARAAEQPEMSPAEVELATKFAAIGQWQGIYDVSVIGAASRSNGPNHLESRYEATAHGTFTLQRSADHAADAARGIFTWEGKGEARGGGAGTFSEWYPGGTGEEWSQEFSGTVEQERMTFSLWLNKKIVSLHPGAQREETEPLMRRTGRMVSAESGGGNRTWPINTTFTAPIDVWFLGMSETDSARRWQVVSNGPGVFVFTHEGPTSGRSQKFSISGAGVIRRSQVVLFPVYDDLEVEVTIADYAKWRPQGSIDTPKKPGNSLVARATLKPKTGNMKDLPKVKHVTFELLDTSHEPGVCLNWPLDAKDDDFDLRLSAAPSFAARLSARDQKNSIEHLLEDKERRPYAETQIDSYDFGGRASLLVRCTLEDRRELLGVMKGEGGGAGPVLLPRQFSGDWIAKKWREDRGVVELNARADDEDAPPGDGTAGDGLTLYEEYRGWVEAGKHIEGDPKTKDFFVHHKAGVALLGIAKFQRLTGLNVHHKFTAGEFPASRVINANRDRGPNITDQHGVILQVKKINHGNKGKEKESSSVSIAVGGPGNPKMISSVDLASGLASLAADYAAITVAHELGHCVNLWHHGDVDKRVIWVVLDGKLYEGDPGGTVGYEISAVNEDGEDLTGVAMDFALDAQASKAPDNRFKLHMGRDQGQHSGAESCVMRYDDSQTFVYRSQPNARFWLFNEPLGNGLCRTGDGSGVNDKSRDTKQPRYGPALSGRGDCLHQIHVTDAVDAPWRFRAPPKP